MIKPGTVEDGFIFIGGDPGQQANWRPVQKLNAQDSAAMSDIRGASGRAQNFANMANEFMRLNRQTGTGPGRALGLGELLPSKTASNLQAMEAIASRAAPSMRVPGSGSTSDKDMALYLASFPKITNWGGSNAEVARGLNQEASKAAARAAYVEKWAQTTGSIAGADAAFENYWASRGQRKRPPATPAAPRANDGWGKASVSQ
jgi:hypothetical protein